MTHALIVPKPDLLQTVRPQFPTQILNIGVSTSALFDTREDDLIFREKGEAAYIRHMREMTLKPFPAGPVLSFVRKMLAFNDEGEALVNLTILSRNNPQVALRVHHSLYAHRLCSRKGALRAGIGEAYVRGRPITPLMLRNFGVDLFLTTQKEDVTPALRAGIAAGQVFFSDLPKMPSFSTPDVLVACDFDRVLGIGKDKKRIPSVKDSEDFFRDKGLTAYYLREKSLARHPAHPGPLAAFYMKLAHLRETLKERNAARHLYLAILTARTGDAAPRVPTTLEHWGAIAAEADFAKFCGSTAKADHLQEMAADIFFDDSLRHVQGAANVTASVLVPYDDRPQRKKPQHPRKERENSP